MVACNVIAAVTIEATIFIGPIVYFSPSTYAVPA